MLIEGNFNSTFGSFGSVNTYKTQGSVSNPMTSKFSNAMSMEGSIFSVAKDKGQFHTALNTDFSLKGFGGFQGDINSQASAFLG